MSLFGGEPLLRKAFIPQFIEFANSTAMKYDKDIAYSMTTNGTLWDEHTAFFVKQLKIRCQLSLDGIEAAHKRSSLLSVW